jgi:methionine synthase I (cobalamin-dependent)
VLLDLLVLETFGYLNELREALSAAREVAGPEMMIVAQITIDDYGNMLINAEELLDEADLAEALDNPA